jgi:hypothetical protein
VIISHEQELQNKDDVLFMSPTDEGTPTLSSEFHDAHEVEEVTCPWGLPHRAGPVLCCICVYPNTEEAFGILSLC